MYLLLPRHVVPRRRRCHRARDGQVGERPLPHVRRRGVHVVVGALVGHQLRVVIAPATGVTVAASPGLVQRNLLVSVMMALVVVAVILRHSPPVNGVAAVGRGERVLSLQRGAELGLAVLRHWSSVADHGLLVRVVSHRVAAEVATESGSKSIPSP